MPTQNPVFKKLSSDSVNQINKKINSYKRSSSKQSNRSIEEINIDLIESKREELQKADSIFKTGKFLSDRIKKKFPSKLFGVPNEEIDENFNDDYVSFIGKYLSNY